MYSAVSIANKYVDLSIKEKLTISNMKLQKLIYIANGVCLAKNDEPLIIEQIEVWPYGPVIRSVYNTYKIFGNSNISPKFFGSFDLGEDLDNKAMLAFQDAWNIGKDISAIKLSNWTHNPDSPWTKAKSENLFTIPDEYMQNYFKKFLEL